MKRIIPIISIFLYPCFIWSQSVLSIEEIMRGEDFVGHMPSSVYWAPDSKEIYFRWNPDGDIGDHLFRTDVKGSDPSKVSSEEQLKLPASRGKWNSAKTHFLYSKHGDLFIYEKSGNHQIRLTETEQNEYNPYFGKSGNEILYQVGNNWFRWDRDQQIIEQLTRFVSKKKSEVSKSLSSQEEWLNKDQLQYFEILQIRKDRNEFFKKQREGSREAQTRQISLDGRGISDIRISPDYRFVTWNFITFPKSRKNTKVPDYVTETGYLDILSARHKVGSRQSSYEMSVYDRVADTVYVIDVKQIPGIYDKPEFLKDYHQDSIPYNNQYSIPRKVIISGPVYNETGSLAVVVVRSQDNKDRWIMELELSTSSLTLLDRQRDEAWVGGPGIGWTYSQGNLGWMEDDESVWFQSEETGYSHLYSYHLPSRTKKSLTKGPFEILDAQLSADKSKFFITSNRPGPEQKQFYHLDADGGDLMQITNRAGGYQAYLSPDEKYLALLYSYSNQPWELYIKENQAAAEEVKITESTTSEFKDYAWRDPKIITFTASDGEQVKARLYTPHRRKRNGAGVIFVHGAGYLQNVHKWWSSYYREYMFHNFLADQGYTVLDIDYRGSAGYGRDWRTAIYRHMGGKDLSDQIDGAKYLVENHRIDEDRIGIYGGSYGGFITLMGLFTSPGTFKAGAALRSVTDWAHYNHGYTSNILNTPVEDSIAYYRSSPIYHAEGLEDHLLMLHGMIDRNVQFQDVVRLSQRLIELGKENWELAVFPKEGHGFVESSSWADEYRRIYQLFAKHLVKKR